MRSILIMILLLPFFFNFSYQPDMDQVNEARSLYLENVVHTSLAYAQIKGYFSSTDIQSLQNQVANALGYPAGDVTVTATETLQTRGEPITLTISIPTRLAFFNLVPATNHATITRSETAASEAILNS
ncbi:hypothetical protein LLE49_25805 [Alicyclobacillus tolerans]|uniref:hypothetical protein n=1 Tax=Alicyclobacillus tolerans TaxID=90970 RepID=UPI001F3F7E1F|nr:hypothetical protein [Alicyclobacillus tolerans]MCF8568144.1 hypothetical protein [Alicyclobacillus tolerans]